MITLQAAHMYLEDGVFHNIPHMEMEYFKPTLPLQWIATAVHPIAKTKLLKFSDTCNGKAQSKVVQY